MDWPCQDFNQGSTREQPNHEAVYRTALATPGLLKRDHTCIRIGVNLTKNPTLMIKTGTKETDWMQTQGKHHTNRLICMVHLSIISR